MTTQLRGIERLAAFEANAWQAYRDARSRAATKPNATTKLAAIEAGARWEARNDDYHEAHRIALWRGRGS